MSRFLRLQQEDEAYQQKTQALREELDAMRAAAANFDQMHLAAAAEVTNLRQAQALEQGQANLLIKQVAALKRDNHLLKVCTRSTSNNWCFLQQTDTSKVAGQGTVAM